MKHIIIAIILLCNTSLLFAQTSPSWMNAKMREVYYSADEYFTGFIPGNIRANESQADAMIRVKEDAQAELARGIRVLVHTQTEKRDQQLQSGDNFQFTSLYQTAAKATAEVEIIGIKTDSHYDAAENLVYGFAYLERSGMISYFNNQIELNLQKIKDALASAQRFKQEGIKVKARQACNEAVQYLANIEYAQDMLTVVDKEATPVSLFIAQTSELRDKLQILLLEMTQQYVLFVKNHEDNFRVPSTVLANKLKSILSKNGCTTTSNQAEADITLIIEAVTRKHDADNPDLKFAYADVVVKIIDNLTEKELFSDEFSVKGGALTHESAGKKALEDSSAKVWERIKPWVE